MFGRGKREEEQAPLLPGIEATEEPVTTSTRADIFNDAPRARKDVAWTWAYASLALVTIAGGLVLFATGARCALCDGGDGRAQKGAPRSITLPATPAQQE